MNIDLSLNEIEVLLLAVEPRNGQDLGGYFRSAKGKLQKARKEMLERYAAQAELFTAEPEKVEQGMLL